MRRNLLVLTIILIISLIGGCSSKKNLNEMFDSFEMETSQIVPYVIYDTLVYGDKSINLNEILKKENINGTFHEVYAIRDNLIWFGYSESNNSVKYWNIASVSLNGSDFSVAFSDQFCKKETADQIYTQNNNKHKQEHFIAANGFYNDGKIVLTDHVKVIEFDLKTSVSKEFLISDYKYPVQLIEVEIVDYQTIRFFKNSEFKIFNLETAKQNSVVFDKLASLEHEKNWQGKSYISELFNKVQIVGDQIYIICSVLNWHGETHAVVFQYDFENNSCMYSFHYFMDDKIGEDLYVVPMIK